MLSINDLQQLDYSSDLTSTGIEYVLAGEDRRPIGSLGLSFDQLQERVAEKAVELAFRRFIIEKEVPHNLVQTKNFGHGEQNSIQLGGRRCRIANLLISHRKDIRLIHSDLRNLLLAKGVFPQNDFNATTSNEDIYIFTAITGLVTRSLSELKKSIAAEQPRHLIYQFPQAWARPSDWKALGPIVFKGDSLDKHKITLTGQDKDRQILKKSFDLAINERMEIEGDFYSLSQIQIDSLPTGAIGVHSRGLQYTLLIAPYQWGNLWLHGLKIFLLGFQSQSEFSRLAIPIEAGKSVFANPRISEDSLAIVFEKLRPVSELFSRARDWAQR